MSSYTAPAPPLWMLPNFLRSTSRVLPALTAGSNTRFYIPFTLSRSRNILKMVSSVGETKVVLPTSSAASDASSTTSSEELNSQKSAASGSSLKDAVAQKIAAQEAKSGSTTQTRRTPLRERVSNKLYVSTGSSSGGSRFNVQSLRAALAAPILAVLGTARPEERPKTATLTVPISSFHTENPTTACALGQNVFLTRSMPNQLPPTLIWSDASWGQWSTVEARYIVHIIPGEQAVRAYGERPYRGKLPPTFWHFVPDEEGDPKEGEGTHVLRLVPQPQGHGGESALSVEQVAEALAFIWEAWEKAEKIQRSQVASSSSDADEAQAKVELPPILLTAPQGLATDASLAVLGLAYKKTLSGGAGRRKSAHTLWMEMVDDEERYRGEWKEALGYLDWEDVQFVEEMWPRADSKGKKSVGK
ncbi:unnamed protein product [Peniophora sp. CBMAI 1063]|nr:unnamed protein product [Peniophora sp. CBMAI 1063]